VARENGLEPLAKIIMAQNKEDIDFLTNIWTILSIMKMQLCRQEILLPNG
jgi:hypothetical protein